MFCPNFILSFTPGDFSTPGVPKTPWQISARKILYFALLHFLSFLKISSANHRPDYCHDFCEITTVHDFRRQTKRHTHMYHKIPAKTYLLKVCGLPSAGTGWCVRAFMHEWSFLSWENFVFKYTFLCPVSNDKHVFVQVFAWFGKYQGLFGPAMGISARPRV